MAKRKSKGGNKKEACKKTTKFFKKTLKLHSCATNHTEAKGRAKKIRKSGYLAIARGRGVYKGGKLKSKA